MTVGVENPSLTPDIDYYRDREELRRERLEDAAGFSAHLAEVATTGIDSDRMPAPAPRIPRQARPKPTPTHSRRGGRSYSEPSDSELDPHWNVKPLELSEAEKKAQVETNRRGRRLADLILAAASETRRDEEEARQRGMPITAIQRVRLRQQARSRDAT